MEVKVRFRSSVRLPPSVKALQIGKYNVEPIPEPPEHGLTATGTYILRFEDATRPGEPGSNPLKEAWLALCMLAVSWDAEIDIEGAMVNSVVVPSDIVGEGAKAPPTVLQEPPEATKYLESLNGLDTGIARQFLRACEAYSAALHEIQRNPTFSFFLLTISVECLSNQVSGGTSHRAKFKDFLTTHGADLAASLPPSQFSKLLGEAYDRHRSAFTHGGSEIPHAALIADRLAKPYVRNIIHGKEVLTPGLRWFQRLVRHALLNFLEHATKAEVPGGDRMKDVSLESGTVTFKAKRALQAGSVVSLDDVEIE